MEVRAEAVETPPAGVPCVGRRIRPRGGEHTFRERHKRAEWRRRLIGLGLSLPSSGADHADVRISNGRPEFVLEVTDDGPRFDQASER